MKDKRGNRIEVGDEVAFPGPYGQSISVGRVARVWQRRRWGSPCWCIRVNLERADTAGKMQRDVYGNYMYNTGITPDEPTITVLITEKANEVDLYERL